MVIIKLKAKIFHVAWWITVMISGNQIASRPCCMVISEALQYSTGLCFFFGFLWWEIAMLWKSILKLHEIKIPISLFSGGWLFFCCPNLKVHQPAVAPPIPIHPTDPFEWRYQTILQPDQRRWRNIQRNSRSPTNYPTWAASSELLDELSGYTWLKKKTT